MANKTLFIGNNSAGLYLFRKELMSKIIENGDEVVALTPFDEKIEELEKLGVRLINTPMDRRGINPVTDFWLFLRYFRILKREKPDRVITYTIKPNVYGALAARLLRIPYAANITGLGTAFQNKGLLRTLVTLMYKLSLRGARVVFFENTENKNIIVGEKIIKEEKCCVLNGAGVNLEQYEVKPYPAADKPVKFLFIGRIMQEKGVDELFCATQRLVADGVECELNVLGYYDEEQYSKKIAEYEAEGWLKYHGFQNDVRPFIEMCHCFVLPSWHEGMANTLLENAAVGRPVITSNIHGCKEAVIDELSGYLCEKQNSDSLYAAMKRFAKLEHSAKREMGIKGREHMENVFDKQKVVQKTIENL